jgi:DNA-binding MarR family transcriptional regulator
MPRASDSTRRTAEQDLDRELLDHLVQTAFVMTELLSRLAARSELSLTQLRLLGILRDREPKMAELADHLGLERSTVTGLIDRAVGRGLVERRADADDARSANVALTPRGHQLARNATADIADDAAFLIDPLSTSDRKQLVDLLRRLSAAASQRRVARETGPATIRTRPG